MPPGRPGGFGFPPPMNKDHTMTKDEDSPAPDTATELDWDEFAELTPEQLDGLGLRDLLERARTTLRRVYGASAWMDYPGACVGSSDERELDREIRNLDDVAS